MVNEINGLPATTGSNANNKGDAVTPAGADSQRATAPSRSDTDRIELSSQAQLLSRLEKQVAELPEVDQARVDEVREAIDNGSFLIDNDGLAQSIIDFER